MEVTVSGKPIGRFERNLVGTMVRTTFRFKRRGRRAPMLTHLPWRAVTFRGNTGARIAGRWFHAEAPKGVVVLAHPDRRQGQQWFLAQGWVEFLLEHGYDALTFDFAGYGESRGGSTYLLEDVVAACHFARAHADGRPVHLVGLSIGAFSAANAAPHLPFLESLVLESPFPTFNAWYGKGWGRIGMAAFDLMFPRTSRLIQAHENIAKASAKRILIAGSRADAVTPVALTRTVAERAPKARTTYLELDDAPHLGAIDAPGFREALARTLGG